MADDHLAAFVCELESRLAKGAVEYGDGSFRRPPRELVGEIEEELLDVAGWSFILWCRIRGLRAQITSTSAESAAGGPRPRSCGRGRGRPSGGSPDA